MRLFRQLQRSDKAPQTDSHGAQIGDLVDFDLRIQLVAALQYLPHLVRRDGIQSASEGNELYQLYIRCATAYRAAAYRREWYVHWFSTWTGAG